MFLNVIWKAAWRVSFHQRYLFYTDVMLSCSEKKIVYAGGSYYLGHRNIILSVTTSKGGRVCSDVKYCIDSDSEEYFLFIFLTLKCNAT